MPFHTDMQRVLRAFEGREREFDWLITDVECSRYPSAFWPKRDAWIVPGDEFAEIIFSESDPVQFIWGVFSGIPPSSGLEVGDLSVYPFADGNQGIWAPPPSIQYPRGKVEIVSFDASSTLLITADANLTARFRAAFPSAVDLTKYIERMA